MGDRQTPHHEIKGYVKNADYAAQSVLAAVTDDTPAAVTVAEGYVVGRQAGGDVGAIPASAVIAAGLGSPNEGEVVSHAAGGAPGFVALPQVTLDTLTASGDTAPTVGAAAGAVGPSAGYYSGGKATQAAPGDAIDVGAISGVLRASNSDTAAPVFFDLAGASIDYTDLTEGAINYIGVQYSGGGDAGGAASFFTTDDYADVNRRTNFVFQRAWRKSTAVYLFQCGPRLQDRAARDIVDAAAIGPVHVSGAMLAGSRLNITLSEGAWKYEGADFANGAIDSDVTNFAHYYYSTGGGTWAELEPTIGNIDNTQYNIGGLLAPLSTGYCAPHWVYLSLNNEFVIVYGQEQYSTLAAALSATPPADLPDYVTDFCIYIGRAIAQQGNIELLTREMAYQDPTVRVANTLSHNYLAGLQGGSASERYHLSVVQVRDLLSEVRVTADDTETKLTSASYRKQILTGSGVMYSLNFGDTTSYPVGFEFEIVNNSANFVRARSNHATSESSASWDTIPPYGTLKARCIDPTVTGGASGGEKEGTWATTLIDKAIADPRYGYNGITDFVGSFSGNTYYSEGGWIGAMSSGSAIMNTANDPSGKQGIARLQVAGVASYALLHNSRYVILGGAAIRRSFHVSKSNANAATDETTMRYGLGSNLTGGAHTNGVSFLNDFTNYGDVYVCRTVAAAGSNDTYSTSVVPAVTPNYDTLTIEVAASGTRVDYFINRKLVRTHSTAANIPSGIALATTMGATKVANTTSRDMYVDWAQVQSYPTTLRG